MLFVTLGQLRALTRLGLVTGFESLVIECLKPGVLTVTVWTLDGRHRDYNIDSSGRY